MKDSGVGRAIFDDINLNFLTEASKELNKSKISHLNICSAEEEFISLYLCFFFNNKLYFFISGFDSKYEDFSLGAVHLKEIIDYCFENNIEEFDFLRGEDEYKYRFHPQSRHTLRTLLWRKSRFNVFWKALFKLSQAIKKSL